MENKIVERIELNTDTGKYIKCNHCNRLSPEQKYCKYCFSLLVDSGEENKAEVRQIYITRGKTYSPVSEFSRIREKIDAEYVTNEIDFSTLGLTEEEYNLKYMPPKAQLVRDGYNAEVSDKFKEAYKKYEQQAVDAYKARREKKEAESIKQIISETPSQIVFPAVSTAAAAETGPQSRPQTGSRNKNLYTIKRASSRFQASFLGITGLAATFLIISTLFLPIYAKVFGLDVISLIPKSLGFNITNDYIAAGTGVLSYLIASGAYMIIAAINLFQLLSFALCVLLDKKQKTYVEFVMSFTGLLAGVIVLSGLLLSGVAFAELAAGAVILFVATAINFICVTGRLVRER